MFNIKLTFFSIAFLLFSFSLNAQTNKNENIQRINQKIIVSANGRFLQYEDGEPFFWLGDTGWLLFEKLTCEEAKQYLENRRDKGFTVIQCMVIHSLPLVNVYGDSAFVDNDISKPLVTPGNDYNDKEQYDFWDHVDYIIDEAAKDGIRIGLVAIWGGVVKQPQTTVEKATAYAEWLANRFKSKPNIFWINGGDLQGNVRPEIWNAIGSTIKANDSNHLITYHPYGRTQSSKWFHNEQWLDFNMFQSGHRRYDQIKNDSPENWKGEDNWRYVIEDYAKNPPKPTLDGEPSYEKILQGLHDPTQPYWTANDCRRYAYWSVFAGACGHTYGDNAVMQMHKPTDKIADFTDGYYGVKNYWYEAIDDSGAFQMQYVKNLVLSRPYFERVFDASLITDQGKRYDYVITTKGKSYLFAYTYTGRPFTIKMGSITGSDVKAWWYNPRNGEAKLIGIIANTGTAYFTPPGEKQNGNDWVLVLDDASVQFVVPGTTN